jgi:hypothetical protein
MRESISRLREMIENLPRVPDVDPFFCALGIPNHDEAKRGLAQAVHAGIMDEIKSMRTDLEGLATPDGKVREKTITRRMLVYKKLKAKAELYNDLLDMQQDQVRAAIGALEQEARNLLVSEEAAQTSPAQLQSHMTPFSKPERAVA